MRSPLREGLKGTSRLQVEGIPRYAVRPKKREGGDAVEVRDADRN